MKPPAYDIASAPQNIESLRACIGDMAAREVLLAMITERVARLSVTDNQLRSVAPALVALGLHGAISSRRFVPRFDRGKGGYANRFASRHPQRHPNASWLLYVAREADHAKEACTCESESSDSGLGALLRYPACCMRWYDRMWPRADLNHQGDLFPLSHAETARDVPAHPLLNFSANYFGGGWTSFFPCSLTCSAAIDVLRVERERISAVEPSLAAAADANASCPVLYTEFRGIARLRVYDVDAGSGCIRFEPDAIDITVDRPRGPLWLALLRSDGARNTGLHGFELMRANRVIHTERSQKAFLRSFTLH